MWHKKWLGLTNMYFVDYDRHTMHTIANCFGNNLRVFCFFNNKKKG